MSKDVLKFRTAYGEKLVVGLECKDPSLAKQSFKDECDVNNILAKWQATGVLPEGMSKDAMFGDFMDVCDYQTALNAVMDAQDMFMELPSSLRLRFENDPAKLLSFLQDPANKAEAISLGLVDKAQPVESVEVSTPEVQVQS